MKRVFTLLLFFFAFGTFNSFASHLQNMEINAEHISGNLYRVSLHLVTECSSIFPGNSAGLNFSNGSSSFVRTLNQVNIENAVSTNYSCHCHLSNSTCNNGTMPGYQRVTYSDTVTLNTSNTWTLSYSTCCRNNAVSNLTNPMGSNQYVETVINQSAYPTNSTPFFPIENRLHISSVDSFETDLSAIDYDGDSIVYALVSARENATTNSLYNPGYSASSPMPGVSLNASNGVLSSYGSTTTGTFVMVIEAKEYDRTSGNLKSTVVKEFYISNGLPNQGVKLISDTPTPNGFLSSSNGTVSGNQLTVCASSNSTAEISYTSSKGNVQLWSNIDIRYPGVSYTITNAATSTLTISVPSNLNLTTLDFYVIAGADSSTFTNLRYDTYSIVLGGLTTSGDQTICLGDSVQMSTTSIDPNPVFNWTYLSGTPIDTLNTSPGYSFSCTNCPNPVITPSVTSQYIVSSPNTCGQPDTVTVTVIQPLSLQTNMYDTICVGDSTLISVLGGITNNLVWEENYNNMNFSGDSIYVSPTSNAYYLIYNPNYLCGDSVYVHITVPQNVDAGSDTTICLGSSVNLSATNSIQSTWNPASSLSCTSCANPTATPNQSTNYTVFNDSYGCLSQDSVRVSVIQPLALQTNMYDTICIGDSTLISVSGGVINNLVWEENYTNMNFSGDSMFVSPTSDAYYLIYNPNYLCGDSVYVHVIVPQNVDAGTDESICLGNSVVLNATNTMQATWSPASSLNCTTCANPTATPTQSTMYTISNDSYGCLSEDSVFVNVVFDRSIMGTAYESNGTSMGSTKVLLIAYNSVDSIVSIVDSAVTDALGEFYFATNSDTNYIKVVPDSATYPNQIPTYYGEEALFLNSTPVVTNACDTSTISVTTISNPNPGGPGFIYGNVYQGAGKTDGAGDPQEGVKIILINANGDEVAYSETDANGAFTFSEIQHGNYQLFMDALDAQNQMAPTINVDEQTMHLVYNYKLQAGALVQISITSVSHLNKEQLVMFPNPAQKHIQIMGLSNSVSYSIIGIDGKSYKQGIAHVNTPINIEELPKGAYIIKVMNDTDEFIQRFIKQ